MKGVACSQGELGCRSGLRRKQRLVRYDEMCCLYYDIN
jgi:hypothetical protein